MRSLIFKTIDLMLKYEESQKLTKEEHSSMLTLPTLLGLDLFFTEKATEGRQRNKATQFYSGSSITALMKESSSVNQTFTC